MTFLRHMRRRYWRMLERTHFPSGKVLFASCILFAIVLALIYSGALTD